MLSSGGLFIAMSFEISPVVLLAFVALAEAALPKRPDIVYGYDRPLSESAQT